MKISTLVSPADMPKIKRAGGWVTEDNTVILPRLSSESRYIMDVLKSEDGQILIDSAGYFLDSPQDAQKTLASRRHSFHWNEVNNFHQMEVMGSATKYQIETANLHGFEIFKSRLYEENWVVLKTLDASADLNRLYRAGRFIDDHLHLVGVPICARVPEEAVGYAYCSRGWGDRLNSEYVLKKLPDRIFRSTTNDPLVVNF